MFQVHNTLQSKEKVGSLSMCINDSRFLDQRLNALKHPSKYCNVSVICVCVQAGDELSSVLVGLQAEKERLLHTVKDQEAEIASLRQAAQLHQITLQQERDRHQREMTVLQNQLQEKVSATSEFH